MGEGWGAGGIRRVAPVVYDDPPSSWEVFWAHPPPTPPPRTNVFLIYRDDPSPPQRKKRKEKKRKKERPNKEKNENLLFLPYETFDLVFFYAFLHVSEVRWFLAFW